MMACSVLYAEKIRFKVQGMSSQHANDPLHGKTLESILKELIAYYGWETLGRQINIRCFNYDPSIQSSLKFLRKTPWARAKVEDLYLIYTVESTEKPE